jgi:predicted metal-dependent peptidase
MTAQQKIDAARFWALTTPHAAFYGALACNLTDVLDDSVGTACTDGKRIRWSPKFVDTLDREQVRFVLLHEVLHCAHLHLWRLPPTKEGNIAGDYVINRTLRGVPGIRFVDGVLDDRKFDALAEEEVLAALRQPQQQPQQQQQQQPQQPQPQQGSQPQQSGGAGDEESTQDGDDGEGEGSPSPGAGKPGKSQGKPAGGPPEDAGKSGGFEAPAPDAPAAKPATAGQPLAAETLQDQWTRNVVQAAQAAQSAQQGNLPAEARRLLGRLTAPAELDWRAETADFLKSTISDRADWSRQARRTALAPVIYPRRRPDAVGTVVVVRDTSGSVDSRLVALFNAHIRDLTADVGCDLVVLDADAVVQAEYRIAAGDDVPDRAEGGGGTDFRPAFARARELEADGERVAGVVYLTDLCGTLPSTDELGDVPVLWVCTTSTRAPAELGRTVRIRSEV